MNCRLARNLFGAYWDDELTQAEREWLESHFTSCSECRREYEDFSRTVDLVGQMPRVEVAPDFADNVLAQARRRSPSADRIPVAVPRWIPITAAAALVAVLGAMVLQWAGGPLPPRPGAPAGMERQAVVQPERIAPEPELTGDAALPTGDGLIAGTMGITDSLFDHAEDVEFILDSVTLRKGRAHTVVSVPADPTRGEPAAITF
jgi:anti-sigma factor RsiW